MFSDLTRLAAQDGEDLHGGASAGEEVPHDAFIEYSEVSPRDSSLIVCQRTGGLDLSLNPSLTITNHPPLEWNIAKD